MTNAFDQIISSAGQAAPACRGPRRAARARTTRRRPSTTPLPELKMTSTSSSPQRALPSQCGKVISVRQPHRRARRARARCRARARRCRSPWCGARCPCSARTRRRRRPRYSAPAWFRVTQRMAVERLRTLIDGFLYGAQHRFVPRARSLTPSTRAARAKRVMCLQRVPPRAGLPPFRACIGARRRCVGAARLTQRALLETAHRMAESKRYQGGCHCGNVRYAVTTD